MVRHLKTQHRDYDVVVTYSLSKRIPGVRFPLVSRRRLYTVMFVILIGGVPFDASASSCHWATMTYPQNSCDNSRVVVHLKNQHRDCSITVLQL